MYLWLVPYPTVFLTHLYFHGMYVGMYQKKGSWKPSHHTNMADMGCSQNSWKTNGSEWVPSFQETVVPSSSSCKQSCACTLKMKAIRSLKMWSSSNPMVHHISGEQNPSSLWDIFGQRKAMFWWANGQWMIRTYCCTMWIVHHNTAWDTDCIICKAGSNCHHCMCSLGLQASPTQSNSPLMAAHLQYQIIIITQFLVIFGKSSLQSTSVPLPDNSSKFCCRWSQPISPSGYSCFSSWHMVSTV